MSRILSLLQEESPVTLAKEALWRTKRRWKQLRLSSRTYDVRCPLVFQPIGYFAGNLPPAVSREAELTVRYADVICQGEFPVLGYGPQKLGCPPPWNVDFVSGKIWRPGADHLAIITNDRADVKVPWELSRLQFLPVLGKAWRLTGADKYAETAKMLISDWLRHNPAGCGINWVVAMEAALRAASLCFACELLWPRWQADERWVQQLTASLWQHLLFIEAHNEFSHFGRSNHYLSNIFGVLCMSSYLQGAEMLEHRQQACELLQNEMRYQVYPDGGDYEASTGYHVFVMQMFTCALRLMRACGYQPQLEFTQRLGRMYELAASLTDGRGRVPQIGDCDDGRVELLPEDLDHMLTAKDRYSLVASDLLRAGAAVLGYTSHDDNCTRVFPNTGLAVYRDESVQVIFAAMPNGMGGKGSHTHNDKLSVLVRIDGEDLLCDSGTFCYGRDAHVRNRMRSTAAHNTVEIDGEEQNRFNRTPDCIFLMSDDARVSEIHTGGPTKATFTATHHGYRRLGVIHTRSVSIAAASVVLDDDFTGHGEHNFAAYFHIPCSWQVRNDTRSGGQVACFLSGHRDVLMSWNTTQAQLDVNVGDGEISGAYGDRTPSRVIAVRSRTSIPFRLRTTISWN